MVFTYPTRNIDTMHGMLLPRPLKHRSSNFGALNARKVIIVDLVSLKKSWLRKVVECPGVNWSLWKRHV